VSHLFSPPGEYADIGPIPPGTIFRCAWGDHEVGQGAVIATGRPEHRELLVVCAPCLVHAARIGVGLREPPPAYHPDRHHGAHADALAQRKAQDMDHYRQVTVPPPLLIPGVVVRSYAGRLRQRVRRGSEETVEIWRCEHEHPSDLEADRCARAEARRREQKP
jgi:hypothetical protein